MRKKSKVQLEREQEIADYQLLSAYDKELEAVREAAREKGINSYLLRGRKLPKEAA